MKNLDHIFKPKISNKYLRKKANKRIKEERLRLKNLGISEKALEEKIKVYRLTEMKKVEDGILTGWRKVRKSQKNDMRKYLLYHNRLESINIKKLNYALPRSVKTHEDFTRYMLRQNLFAELFIELQQFKGKKSFPCFLFPDNWASISKDDEGIYHYFTNRPEGISVSLNIFDFIEIICSMESESFADHRRRLIQILGCSYPEQRWEIKQFEKTRFNINSISNAKTNWNKQFPSLYKLTRRYLDILLELNSYSEKHVNSKQYTYKKEPLFYVASRYLADRLDRDPTNVRRAINMFACLGLIVKVPPDVQGFPHKFLQSAVKIRGNVTDNKLITFYIIPKITQKLLRSAESKAKRLFKNNITNINKFNEKNVAEVLGEEIAKSIYYTKEIDIQKLIIKSGVDLAKTKQANTFQTKREIERLKSEQGTFGDDVIPF